ncbi:hypothetical protein ACT024_27280, partial [Enterobacter mori]
ADRNRSHWSTSKTPSYTKSVSWQHHLIVAGIAKRKNVIYAPGKWQLIMLVIKHLPSFIFNKMDI